MRFLTSLLFALLATVFLCSTATQSGWVEGTVLSLAGDPLPNAAVRIADTARGQAVDARGHFRFAVRPGKHALEISHIGFETEVLEVVIVAGQTLMRNVVLEPAAPELMKIYRVTGNQVVSNKPIEHSETLYTDDNFDDEDTELLEQISRKPGVTLHQGQLSIRGLKPSTTQIQVDGIPVSSPLDGQAVQLATNAVQGAEIMVGGADAEHGQFQGGVINLHTKEGTDRFRGSFRYSTDDYGAPDKTYTNFDQVSLGFGGPLVPGRLRYYLSFQGTWQDTHLPTHERRGTLSLLDFIQIRDRQRNGAQGQAKLSWKLSPQQNVSLEFLGNEQKWDSYQHNFNRVGFVETQTDTTFDSGEVVTRYGDFSEQAKGPNWVFYDGPAHTPNYTSTFNQLKLIYNHQVFDSSLLSVKVSKHGFVNRETVNDQEAWQYEEESPWRNAIHGESHPYFATHGDIPLFAERNTDVFTTKTAWTSVLGAHQMKAGLNLSENTFSVRSLLFPSRLNADGQYGLVRSEFTAHNWEASGFVQDRWEHEGMVVNVGLRYDLLNVGDQLGPDEVQNRMRGAMSPRVGFAYPVTSRDVFSFHYGRYDQTPSRQAIFENRGNFVTVRGNPDLKNETTVAYQAALQHLFSPGVFGQFSLYFRDIFGQLSVERVQSENTPGDINIWSNRDYASSRGFEVSVTKRFERSFSAELAYTYGIATGVASDPEQQSQVNFLYLPVSEQPLNWDRRHDLSAQLELADPKLSWNARLVWNLRSGLPYTPVERDERRRDPSRVNSKRLPATTDVSLQVAKRYKMWGQVVQVFVNANNLLDTRNIENLAPRNLADAPGTSSDDYLVYYTETGKAGGAYLGKDENEDGIRDWEALNDPRVFGASRTIRMGLSVNF